LNNQDNVVVGYWNNYSFMESVSILRHNLEKHVDNALSTLGIEKTPYRFTLSRDSNDVELIEEILSVFGMKLEIVQADRDVFRGELVKCMMAIDKANLSSTTLTVGGINISLEGRLM